VCSPLGVNKGVNFPPRTQSFTPGETPGSLWSKFTPRGKLHPWGQTMLLKTSLCLVLRRQMIPSRPVCSNVIEILHRSRTSMFAQVLQTFWAKKPCKKSADLYPRRGNLLHWNIVQGSTKPLFTTQNMLEMLETVTSHSTKCPRPAFEPLSTKKKLE
jgi:hypothetical protein